MKPFVVYTLARAGLFVVAWALVWAVAYWFVPFDQVTALGTALVALAISSVASWWLLRDLRDRVAGRVEERAQRISARIEQSRTAEDEPPPRGGGGG